MACCFGAGTPTNALYVVPETGTIGLELPPLHTPIKTAPFPLKKWYTSYVKRKNTMGEQKIQVQSGNTYAYWMDGELTQTEVVLAFHDIGNCKSQFLQPSSLPHLCLIAIDLLGHGASSSEPTEWGFQQAIPEIIEFLDQLNVETLHVVGHGHGGIWALQTAAALGDRAKGCATFGTPNNVHHAAAINTDKHLIGLAQHAMPIPKTQQNSCMGRTARATRLRGLKHFVHVDKTIDFGMAKYYEKTIKEQHGGDERSFAALDHNLFLVSSFLDAALFGVHTAVVPYQAYQRMWDPWHYDISTITCHTFLYHGHFDACYKQGNEIALARQVGKHGSKVTMLEHGHSTIMLEFAKVVLALCRGQKVSSSYHRTHMLMPAAKDKLARDSLAVVAQVHRHNHSEHVPPKEESEGGSGEGTQGARSKYVVESGDGSNGAKEATEAKEGSARAVETGENKLGAQVD